MKLYILHKWSIGLLIIIGVFFLGTRLYQINTNPPSLYWDEASIGVNAYSILTTGRDEWGTPHPLNFRAFGEFKLPVYIYTVAGLMSLLGKTELAVRLPAVLFTAMTLLFSFLIFRKYFGTGIATLGVFLLSVTPWLFLFSRTGYEATAGLAFFLAGLYFFLNSLENTPKFNYAYFLGAHLAWAICLFSYNSYRVILPLALPLFYIYLWLTKIQNKTKAKAIIVSLFLMGLAAIPVLRLVTSQEGLTRYQAVGVIDLGHKGETIAALTQNYLKNFSLQFLAISGDSNSRSHTQFGGELLWVEIILSIAGLIQLSRGRLRDYWLFLGLLAISPLPVAITKESPHVLRGLTMLPMLIFFALLGIQGLLKATAWKNGLIAIVITLSLGQWGLYYLDFIQNYSRKFSTDWQYGYRQLFRSYSPSFKNFDHVYISDYLAQPYIFDLFYGREDLAKFRENVQYGPASDWGFSTVRSIGNVEFVKSWSGLDLKGSLVFASPQQRLDNVKAPEIISNPDDSVAFYVYNFK